MTITTIAENSNRDIYRDPVTGNLAFVSGAYAIAQLCKSRIEAQRGEMIYAADEGMPTRATAWDLFNPKQFEAAARVIILATDGVTSITSFNMSSLNNVLSYTAVINTIYGTATITS